MVSHYTQKFPVPDGFQDILHDFSREVLKDQPENIYHYGFLYFKAMEQGMDFHYETTKKKLGDMKVSDDFIKKQQEVEQERKPNHAPKPQAQPQPQVVEQVSPQRRDRSQDSSYYLEEEEEE
eukprot:403375180